MKIKVTMEVKVPIVPNDLQLSDGQVVPLYAIADDGQHWTVGQHWTESLIARSREMKSAADQALEHANG